jgi:hypothetical protein
MHEIIITTITQMSGTFAFVVVAIVLAMTVCYCVSRSTKAEARELQNYRSKIP